MDIGDGADIEPAGRLVGEDDVGSGGRGARPRISFCMLPPDKSRMRVSGDGHFTFVIGDKAPGEVLRLWTSPSRRAG